MGQGRRWIEAAGGVVEDEGNGAGFEVSPLISYVGLLFVIIFCTFLAFRFLTNKIGWRGSRTFQGQGRQGARSIGDGKVDKHAQFYVFHTISKSPCGS